MDASVESTPLTKLRCSKFTGDENPTTCYFKFDYDEINKYLKSILGDDYIFKGYISSGRYGKVVMYCTKNCEKCVAVKIQVETDKPPLDESARKAGCKAYAGIKEEHDMLVKFHQAGIALSPIGDLVAFDGFHCNLDEDDESYSCCDPDTERCPTTVGTLKRCNDLPQPTENPKGKKSKQNNNQKMCRQCDVTKWKPQKIYVYAMEMGDMTLQKYLTIELLDQYEFSDIINRINDIYNKMIQSELTHGDMHLENITVKLDKNDKIKDLKLIDTGRSSAKGSNYMFDLISLMRSLAIEIESLSESHEAGQIINFKVLYNMFKQYFVKQGVESDIDLINKFDVEYWDDLFRDIENEINYFDSNCIDW